MGRITVFAPATVGNVICGFDVLGLALERPGDHVRASRSETPGVRIVSVTGRAKGVPKDAAANSAGAAVASLLAERAPEAGVELELRKGLPLASGMGGSAASAVAGVVAADVLLETDAGEDRLFRFALEGERAASGQGHGDNVGPALVGGLVLVRLGTRRPLVRLPVPPDLAVVLLRPHLELATREARAALPPSIPLGQVVEQLGHVAGFVSGLSTEDWELVSDALVDRIAEPVRAERIPAYEEVRSAALAEGALGCGISGAGPSLFSLCRGRDAAERVGEAMAKAYAERSSPGLDLLVSGVSAGGARIVDDEEWEEGAP